MDQFAITVLARRGAGHHADGAIPPGAGDSNRASAVVEPFLAAGRLRACPQRFLLHHVGQPLRCRALARQTATFQELEQRTMQTVLEPVSADLHSKLHDAVREACRRIPP